jgi:hypothetical protein
MRAVTRGSINIRAVLVAADDSGLFVLTLAGRQKAHGRRFSLPYAAFDPARGQSVEDRLRDWASVHTTAQITQIIQVETRVSGGDMCVDLLALVSDRSSFMPRGASWTPIYELFPWEDWRKAEPDSLAHTLRPALMAWAAQQGATRNAAFQALFPKHPAQWQVEHCGARFDMLYNAALLPESLRDRTGAAVSVRQRHAGIYGQIMHGNDRGALANALSLLRSRVSHTPIMPHLMSGPFTLGAMQQTLEAMTGVKLHTQNFRRDLVRLGKIENTHKRGRSGASRPAGLWVWNKSASTPYPSWGMPLPRKAMP